MISHERTPYCPQGMASGLTLGIRLLRSRATLCSLLLLFYIFVFVSLNAFFAYARSPSKDEMSTAKRWVAAKFSGQPEPEPAQAYLTVYLKSGSVQRDSIAGHPLRIRDKVYSHGLHCPSIGKVDVHLPSAGKAFHAVVGLDSNDVGYYANEGRGSLIASVEVGGEEKFRTPVLREGVAGVPVQVDLSGATEFALRLTDAGDGIVFGNDFNQADWAEAQVVLTNGNTIKLKDLPVSPLPEPFTSQVPFSFRYEGQPSTELLKIWELKRSVRHLDNFRVEHTLTYTDPKTGLVVRCVGIAYEDFPVVEWTVYFKNNSASTTPLLENILALDSRIERDMNEEFVLHHSRGTPNSPTDYQPLETKLEQKAEKRISAAGGRPTNSDLCYFNLQWSGQGVIIGLGWPGQWAAQFTRDEGTGLRVRAGQELTHFKLLPGEEVRSPLVALLFWKGDWINGQNIWRRWMNAHNLPRPGGKLPPPQWAASSGRQDIEMQGASEQNQIAFIDRYLAAGLNIDYWWMDAGWYSFKDAWWNVGTWELDPRRFPRGFQPITAHAHEKGIKIIVWFEPERVTPGTWIFETHPEWLLGRSGGNRLLNLGNPEAWKWLVNHVDKLIIEQGIDLYRQDFNFDPLPYWQENDAEDRQGITEIKHVTGYLDYWDELRRRHPNLLIDTCASGGRRNDLETLRRAVPLWRSDYAYEPAGMQQLTYGIALWIPYFGTGINSFDAYTFRSQMAPAIVTAWDPSRQEVDPSQLRRFISQWRQVSEFYEGDFYPITSYSTSTEDWIAWQFDDFHRGEGMVQAFRRPASPYESARFKLRGLESAARYAITNLDETTPFEMTGQELMESGLLVRLKEKPAAAILIYKQIK